MNFYEDLEVGSRRDIGAYSFSAEAIKKFAATYDPQRFHLDEEEGRKSLFGGLAASGWHIASVCMRVLVTDGQRRTTEAHARGEQVGTPGPSPGIRDLRWIRPVLAGDTISFSTTLQSKRVSASRPGWGVLQTRADGVNQRGEQVFSIGDWAAFVPLRDAPG